MRNPIKALLFVFAILISTTLRAQEMVKTATKTDEGFMKTEGKVYVVAAVVITILLGLILYVARLDSKITKLEKETKR